jgi:hypothetical protein
MTDPWGGNGANEKKADRLADIMNRLLQDLSLRSSKGEVIYDYFHVGVMGYGVQVGPAFSGTLAGRQLVPLSEVANSPARIEERNKKVPDGAGGLVEQSVRFPIWFEPVASGATPMNQALGQAKGVIENWLSQHPDCFPPTVINITDGEATDGDPSSAAEQIRQLKSSDGDVLLFNIHCSSQRSQPIAFPTSDAGLPDQFARQLFGMSSVLTPRMVTLASEHGYSAGEGARGFVFNAEMPEAIAALDIGTRPSELK